MDGLREGAGVAGWPVGVGVSEGARKEVDEEEGVFVWMGRLVSDDIFFFRCGSPAMEIRGKRYGENRRDGRPEERNGDDGIAVLVSNLSVNGRHQGLVD